MATEHFVSPNLPKSTIGWIAIISALITLSVFFSPFNAAMGSEEGAGNMTTTTTCIITRQEGSGSGNNTQNKTTLIQTNNNNNSNNGIGNLLDDIDDRINNLISSATNITSTGDGAVNMQLSGKIVSARFNLSSGEVEQTFFGNWSIDIRGINNASFSADFLGNHSIDKNNNITEDTHYKIGNLTLSSFQRVNEHVVLGGAVDVLEERGMRSWKEIPVSLLIINSKEFIISFEEPGLNEVFSNQPIIGVVAAT